MASLSDWYPTLRLEVSSEISNPVLENALQRCARVFCQKSDFWRATWTHPNVPGVTSYLIPAYADRDISSVVSVKHKGIPVSWFSEDDIEARTPNGTWKTETATIPNGFLREMVADNPWYIRPYPYWAATAGTVVDITAITAANPAVVSADTADLTTGDTLYIDSVSGMTEINAGYGTVIVLGDGSFSIDIDASTYTAYTTGGSARLCDGEVELVLSFKPLLASTTIDDMVYEKAFEAMLAGAKEILYGQNQPWRDLNSVGFFRDDFKRLIREARIERERGFGDGSEGWRGLPPSYTPTQANRSGARLVRDDWDTL